MSPSKKYIAFHKPYGVLSQFTDASGRPTLKAYIPLSGVYAAGRLDMDSEGLLILTNDGNLIQRLADPQFHQPKTYWVQVEGEITSEALGLIRQGLRIPGCHTRPCKAQEINAPGFPERSKPVTPHGPTSWIEITITEGKKRQVRHMTAAVGFPTLRLVRVAIGSIHLGGLKPGEWRFLEEIELQPLTGQSDTRAAFRARSKFAHKR